MIDQIGTTAGQIWHYLEENVEATVNKLASELETPERVILMGLGWLAREDKVIFSVHGRYIKIALNASESE